MLRRTALLTFTSITLAAAAASGCAALETDCTSDWYLTGQRDGRMGADPQDGNYAARCAAPVDRARYYEGWKAGVDQRPTPSS